MKTILSVFLFSLLAFSTSQATSYVPVSIPQLAERSQLIVVATVWQKSCVDEKGIVLKANADCTSPGSANKLTYQIKIKEILFQNKKLKEKVKANTDIDFAFTSAAHTGVPADNYQSDIGRDQIFFLMKDKEDKWEPVHEAFFQKDMNQKKEVLKAIKKRK